MSVGYNAQLSKDTVDVQLGQISQRLNVVMEDIDDLKFFLDTALDPELVALGYSPEDVALIRSAAGDLDQIRRVYQGLEAVPEAKDFRAFIRRVWGTGFSGS